MDFDDNLIQQLIAEDEDVEGGDEWNEGEWDEGGGGDEWNEGGGDDMLDLQDDYADFDRVSAPDDGKQRVKKKWMTKEQKFIDKLEQIEEYQELLDDIKNHLNDIPSYKYKNPRALLYGYYIYNEEKEKGESVPNTITRLIQEQKISKKGKGVELLSVIDVIRYYRLWVISLQ